MTERDVDRVRFGSCLFMAVALLFPLWHAVTHALFITALTLTVWVGALLFAARMYLLCLLHEADDKRESEKTPATKAGV